MGLTLAALVGIALAAYNARATWLLWRSEDFERSQKIAQTAFVWLVPIIGAVVVMNVLKPEVRVYRGGDESDG